MKFTRRHAPLAVLVAALALACRADSSGRSASPPDRAAAAEPGAQASQDRDTPPASQSRQTEAPAAGSGDPEKGPLAGLTAAHNRVRAPLELPPLVWSDELADFAQAWADTLQRQGCRLQHRPHSGPHAQRYGENIFSQTGHAPTASDVVGAWAAEVSNYDAKRDRCRGICGHYTQIVWRKSERLGCAMAACGDTQVWVCNYDPPGNVVGKRPY